MHLLIHSCFQTWAERKALMYERTAFFSRVHVVPANSTARMHAPFLPLLMRMYNWYSDDPDPTFIFLYI